MELTLHIKEEILLEVLALYASESDPRDMENIIRDAILRLRTSHSSLDIEKASEAFWNWLVTETQKRYPHWSPAEHHTSETDNAD
jgi:hypothetical protein